MTVTHRIAKDDKLRKRASVTEPESWSSTTTNAT